MAPILEINPRHALIRALADPSKPPATDVTDAAQTLLDLARVQDGEPPATPPPSPAASPRR